MVGFCRRRSVGAQRLDEYSKGRATRLGILCREEAARSFGEAKPEVKEEAPEDLLHPQCLKDFDRADYTIGEQEYLQGAAAASPGGVESARLAFAERLREECSGLDASDNGFVRAVSCLASQISMAHLGSVCFSGPHSYALPSGSVRVTYGLRREGQQSSQGKVNIVYVDIARVAEGFTSFSLPDGEAQECSKASLCRQTARFRVSMAEKVMVEAKVRVRVPFESSSQRSSTLEAGQIGTVRRLNEDGHALIQFAEVFSAPWVRKANFDKLEVIPQVEVLAVSERLQLVWPDGRLITQDGLTLDISYPPEAKPGLIRRGLQGVVNALIKLFGGPLRVAGAAAALAAAVVVGVHVRQPPNSLKSHQD